MRYKIIRERKWERALPHFDVRVCPDCGALVFRQAGQNRHQADHDTARELLELVRQRCGIEEADDGGWAWTATVTVGRNALEDGDEDDD